MANVVVTGGSRGLGLGIAKKLVSSGFRVIAIARNETEELAKALRETDDSHPGSLRFISFDLACIDKLPDLVKNLHKEYGPIYGLVNNAGTSIEGTLALCAIRDIENVIRLNTLSPIVLTKCVVRTMMAEGVGRIVNIASIVASTGYSGLSVYAASKASIVGFTRSLARDVGRVGITVNAVAPGFIRTEMTKGVTPEQLERIVKRSALHRLADIEDVANAVDFLLSERSRSITGTVLTVDAGGTA